MSFLRRLFGFPLPGDKPPRLEKTANLRPDDSIYDTEPRVIEYVTHRGWGHDFTFTPKDDEHGSGSLFNDYAPLPGDFIIMPSTERAGDTTRYRITDVRRAYDPPDMYFWDGELARRTQREKARDHYRFGLLTRAQYDKFLQAMD